MIQKKVVAHYQNGQLFKGTTNDFFPSRDLFHLTPIDESKPLELSTTGLKGLFFVKDFWGNQHYHEKKEFDSDTPLVGYKIRAIFNDGELMIGTTNGYQEDLPGIIVVPADYNSNNESCFIVTSAIKEVSII